MIELRWLERVIGKTSNPDMPLTETVLQYRFGVWGQDIPSTIHYEGSVPVWCGNEWQDVPVVREP